MSALVIGIGLLRALGVVVRRTWAGKTQWRVAGTLGEGVVDRLVRQPISWHQRRPDGDLVARAGVDTDAAISVLAPIPFATGTVLLIVVSAIWLLAIDLVMGAVAVAVFPVLIGLNIVYQKRVDAFYDAAQGHLGDLSAGVHESFDGVQLVKAYGAEQRETERLATIAGRLRTARVGAVRLRGTFEALLDVLPSMTNVGLVVLGAFRVRSGDVTVGDLSSFIYLFTLLVFPLRLIGYALSELPHSVAGWRRVREVLDEPIEPDPPPTHRRRRRTARGAARRRRVHVPRRVPRRRSTDVSLDVAAGRIVAIVGPTGVGQEHARRDRRRAGRRRRPAPSPWRRDRGRSCSRRRSCSPARSATTSCSATTSARPRCGRRCAWPGPTTSWPTRRTGSTPSSASAASA